MPPAKYKYIDGSPTRQCSYCDEIKPLDDFRKSKRGKAGTSAVCKECSNRMSREWYRNKRNSPAALEEKRLRKEARKKKAAEDRRINGVRPGYKYDYVAGDSEKSCSRCNIKYPIEDFPKNSACYGGHTGVCKHCNNERGRVWRKKQIENNPEFVLKRKLSQQKARAKKYGMTLDELRELELAADAMCEICGNQPSMNGGSSNRLHVDHNHLTGKVRGLLCGRCNVVIGQVEESVELMMSIISYLHKYKEQHDNT